MTYTAYIFYYYIMTKFDYAKCDCRLAAYGGYCFLGEENQKAITRFKGFGILLRWWDHLPHLYTCPQAPCVRQGFTCLQALAVIMDFVTHALQNISGTLRFVSFFFQHWLYCREHLKYVECLLCFSQSHKRSSHHRNHRPSNERFPIGHGTNYFCFVLTFSLFTSKQLLFLPICLQYVL